MLVNSIKCHGAAESQDGAGGLSINVVGINKALQCVSYYKMVWLFNAVNKLEAKASALQRSFSLSFNEIMRFLLGTVVLNFWCLESVSLFLNPLLETFIQWQSEFLFIFSSLISFQCGKVDSCFFSLCRTEKQETRLFHVTQRLLFFLLLHLANGLFSAQLPVSVETFKKVLLQLSKFSLWQFFMLPKLCSEYFKTILLLL